MNKKSVFSVIFPPKIPLQQRINFARHLAVIIKAGLPLIEGLKILKRQAQSKKMEAIISGLISDVNNGQFLADSLEKYNAIFGEFFINVVRIGEASGTLASNLAYLAEEMEKSRELKRTIRGALIYPIVILVATLGVTSILVFFIFPKILPVFSSLKIKLPLSTVILIATLGFLLHYGYLLLIGLVVLVLFFRLIIVLPAVKLFFDRVILVLPVISSLSINLNNASFARVLSVLLKSGIQIVDAIITTSNTFDNLVYKKAFIAAAEEVKKGEQFFKYLSRHPKLFPPLLTGMIEIGENTGNLEENLAYVSDYYTKEVDASVKSLTTLLEPLLLLTMGLIVGFVAVSIITPIYQISSGIHP